MENKHILKNDWLMYKRKTKIGDLVKNSPTVNKDILDGFGKFLKGIAIELTNGKKYVSTYKTFNENKVEIDGKYYMPEKLWKVY